MGIKRTSGFLVAPVLIALALVGCSQVETRQVQTSAAVEAPTVGAIDVTAPASLPMAEPPALAPTVVDRAASSSASAATVAETPGISEVAEISETSEASVPDPEQPRFAALTGRITPEGTFEEGEITQFVWPYVDGDTRSPDSLAELVVRDQTGAELHRHRFNVDQQIGDTFESVPWVPGMKSVGDIEASSTGELFVRVRYPSFEQARALAVELDGVEVWREEASETAPTVSIAADGSIVSWEVDDADGVPPKTVAYYLIDGWEQIEVVGGSMASTRPATAPADAFGDSWVDLRKAGFDHAEGATAVIFASDGFNYTLAAISDDL